MKKQLILSMLSILPFQHDGEARALCPNEREPAEWIDAPRAIMDELGLASFFIRATLELDVDGRTDLLAYSVATRELLPILNVGTNRYEAGPPFTSLGLTWLRTGDLTGDGIPDVVTDDSTSGAALVFHENLGGTFAPLVTIPTPGSSPIFGVVGQADESAARELLEVYQAGAFYYARWWSFAGSTATPGPGLLIGPIVTAVALTDLDGDGSDEVILAARAEDEILVLRTGDSFTLSVERSLSIQTTSPTIDNYELAVGDADGDGDSDAVVTWFNWPQGAWVYRTIENTTGSLDVLHPTRVNALGLGDPHLVDWDGDGDLDLVGKGGGRVVNGTLRSQGIVQLENIGGLQFTNRGLIPAVGAVLAPTDLNGDSYPDFVTSRGVKSGNGAFENSDRMQCPGLTSGRAIDLDADGDLDIVASAGIVYFNDGEGSMTTEQLEDRLTPYQALANPLVRSVGDLDGDGHVDVIVRSYAEELLLLGIGGGQFVASGPATQSGETFLNNSRIGIEPVDIDGDGDLDIVTERGWAQNDGTGFFDVSYDLWNARQRVLAIADADLDGDVDVATTVDFTRVDLQKNDGFGNFVAEPLAPQSFNRGTWADLDGDALPEFITNRNGSGTIEVYENVDGSFPYMPIVLESVHNTSLFAHDFDGDGRPDLMGTDDQNPTPFEATLVWRNMGGPVLQFDAPRYYTTNVSPVLSADIDGDGDVDLLKSRVIRNWNRKRKGKSCTPKGLALQSGFR